MYFQLGRLRLIFPEVGMIKAIIVDSSIMYFAITLILRFSYLL